uniref:Thyropin n=1 Tax=Rhipicephalus zambeziensis TaxID=60191 RepID=A0A224YF04_9ACAR
MARISFFTLAIFALVGYVYCASTRETDCQRRRRTEQGATRNLTGLLVPECDEHGNYKAIQCFGQTVRGGRPFCACYDTEFGQIKGPSRNLRSCNCIREHHEWERRSRSQQGPEPRCDATSGEYNPMQCDVSSHWCVETDSGRQLGERQPGGCSESLSSNSCGVGGTHHGHNASQPRHHGGDHSGSHGDHHRGTSHDGTSSHGDHTSQRSGSSGSRGTSGSSGHDDSSHTSGSSRGSSGTSSHDDDSHQGSSGSSHQGSSGHSSSGTSHSSHN